MSTKNIDLTAIVVQKLPTVRTGVKAGGCKNSYDGKPNNGAS